MQKITITPQVETQFRELWEKNKSLRPLLELAKKEKLTDSRGRGFNYPKLQRIALSLGLKSSSAKTRTNTKKYRKDSPERKESFTTEFFIRSLGAIKGLQGKEAKNLKAYLKSELIKSVENEL